MDEKWWLHHLPEVRRTFRGDRYSHGVRAGVHRVRHRYYREQGQNSGAGAIALADHFGPRRVFLLGYDCQYTGGRRHWHPDHTKEGGSGNAGSIASWPAQFRQLQGMTPGLEIINCTRETALTVFPRAKLEDVL